MTTSEPYFSSIKQPLKVVTAIDSGRPFPELLASKKEKYNKDIELFCQLVAQSRSSATLLEKIRKPKLYNAKTRMSLLKLFRRCVCTVCDTEATKKIKAKPTSEFVTNFGHLFKDINVLQKQFSSISEKHKLALAALLGEYDHRGKQG